MTRWLHAINLKFSCRKNECDKSSRLNTKQFCAWSETDRQSAIVDLSLCGPDPLLGLLRGDTLGDGDQGGLQDIKRSASSALSMQH